MPTGTYVKASVGDLDPEPDPDPHVLALTDPSLVEPTEIMLAK